MIRIAICDDNNNFVNYMTQAVEHEFRDHTSEEFQIVSYVSSTLLLDHHLTEPFQLIFLDIDMPELDGFQLASKISASNECYIIFVTSHPELVYDSFYFRPLNFITKGNDSYFTNKLHSVINQFFNEIKQNTIVILENKDIGRVSLVIRSIYYIESNKHYVTYHSEGRESITVRGSINELENYFSAYDFVRIHKSYLVNLRHIFNLDKSTGEIIFKQGFRLSLSKNYKQAVDKSLTQYLRRTK